VDEPRSTGLVLTMTDDTTIVEFGAEGEDPIPHIRAALAGYEMDDKNVESVHVEITLNDGESTGQSDSQSNDTNPGRIYADTREHWALTCVAEYLDRNEVETFRNRDVAEAHDFGKGSESRSRQQCPVSNGERTSSPTRRVRRVRSIAIAFQTPPGRNSTAWATTRMTNTKSNHDRIQRRRNRPVSRHSKERPLQHAR